jgi:hypothetical protein
MATARSTRIPRSTEHVNANDEHVVLRVGEQFVSTRTVDLTKREVDLQVELKPGAILPDFFRATAVRASATCQTSSKRTGKMSGRGLTILGLNLDEDERCSRKRASIGRKPHTPASAAWSGGSFESLRGRRTC